MDSLILDIEGKVAIITINRPEKLNALSEEVFNELDKTIDLLDDNENISCVVVTGAGEKAFVSGGDISVIKNLTTVESYNYSRKAQEIIQKISHSSKVYIAAVNGYALGGGFELALGCDFIYASQNAKFGFPEVKLGILPGFGGTQRLPRTIGKNAAKELMFTGKIIDANKAKELGIVLEITKTTKELIGYAKNTAKTISENAPVAVALTKRAIEEGMGLPEDEAMKYESTLFGIAVSTEDAKEGTEAFFEKRKPKFKNR
jgi:enoyl-CoA hydratase